MSKGAPYAVESRFDIVKSGINNSTSKTMWSFSKDKRFPQNKPVCPYVSYQNNLSTLSHRKTGFGSSKRRVFSQVSQVPTSWVYNPDNPKPQPTSLFALGRQTCLANSYYPSHPQRIPGPGRYRQQKSTDKKRGYSMRPKTAYQRTYFIDNKELKLRPSPFQYNVEFDDHGKESISKFRTVTMGGASLNSKHDRFKDFNNRTPSPFVYQPKKYAINKFSKGGKIGRGTRHSFVDEASRSSYTPGPGNYQPSTEFGHYKKHWLSVA